MCVVLYGIGTLSLYMHALIPCSLRSMGISDPLPVVKPKVSAISLLTSNYDSCDQVVSVHALYKIIIATTITRCNNELELVSLSRSEYSVHKPFFRIRQILRIIMVTLRQRRVLLGSLTQG